jgi:hypothetical protein
VGATPAVADSRPRARGPMAPMIQTLTAHRPHHQDGRRACTALPSGISLGLPVPGAAHT